MNDVDPTTMSLAEIYDLPDSYFDPYSSEEVWVNGEDRVDGVQFVKYEGAFLRPHGRQIFTIKPNDPWEMVDGTHYDRCEWCEGYFTGNLLSVDPEESKRPHP